ncbi:MAG TPA: flagellar basal body rod protein FlgC [Candidatus Dormibacteraeota bacterium]|nr:flagellar basal body rod protein FlgC [Candidatus Dormibacteraeota bacterium]
MGFYDSIDISASGLTAERLAMDVIANNIANAQTTRTPQGGPFKRQLVVFAQKQATAQGGGFVPDPVPADQQGQGGSAALDGVQAVGIAQDNSPDRLVYEPGNPDADANGYVHMPNVQVVKEMVDLMAASRAYEANVTAIEQAKTLDTNVLNVLHA